MNLSPIADGLKKYLQLGIGMTGDIQTISPGGGGGTAASITIGTTAIINGTDKRVLFDDAGLIGESAGLTYTKSTGVLSAVGFTALSVTELAPALTAGNWTVGAGWESPIVGPGLIKNADGTGTQTPSAATNIVAATTYKVTITLSAASAGSATYTVGGVAGASTLSAAQTYTDYVTTTSTGKLIITPTNTSRFTISAISILAVGDYKGTVGIGNPLPGAFTTVTATGLSATQIPVVGTGGLLTGSSSLTFSGGTLVTGGGITANGTLTVNSSATVLSASVSSAAMRANMTNNQNTGTTAYSSINNSGKLAQIGIYGSTATPFGAILAGSGYIYTDSAVGLSIGTNAASPISLYTGTAALEQVRILDTASATRYVTLTGSNGGNPQIGASAGQLIVQNGANFGPGLPTSLTIVGGIVTAAS